MKRAIVGLLLAFTVLGVEAQTAQGTIKVAWDAVADRPGATLAGYRVCVGTTPGTYPVCDSVGKVTATTVAGLADCTTYYVAVKAVDTDGDESAGWSNEISGWAAPRIGTVTPGNVTINRPTELTITGANFQAPATVTISNATVGLVTVASCNSIKAMVTASQVGQPTIKIVAGGVASPVATGTFLVTDIVRPDGVSGVRRGEQ